jgi:hypothetical protein
MASSSDASDDDEFIAPAPASAIQGISIHHHVPVVLDLEEGNYGQLKVLCLVLVISDNT